MTARCPWLHANERDILRGWVQGNGQLVSRLAIIGEERDPLPVLLSTRSFVLQAIQEKGELILGRCLAARVSGGRLSHDTGTEVVA